jgi:general secretion pathway protein N
MASLRLQRLRRSSAGPNSRFSIGTATGFGESTFAELAWRKTQAAARRWALWGCVLGALVGLVAFAPATWLAAAVSSATAGRLLLAEARGTVWDGSAVVVVTGGEGSRDAASLPGRLGWSLGWAGLNPRLRLTQPCCLGTPVEMLVKPGLGRVAFELAAPASLAPGAPLARWPAEALTGLGTPWNTMQLKGDLRLTTPGMSLEWVSGRWIVSGSADIDLVNASSRLSTLEPLGTYRLSVAGDPAAPGQSTLSLTTQGGALVLSGQGSAGQTGLRFKGEASAAPEHEAALNNLLNIIGRRSGARSLISIG